MCALPSKKCYTDIIMYFIYRGKHDDLGNN